MQVEHRTCLATRRASVPRRARLARARSREARKLGRVEEGIEPAARDAAVELAAEGLLAEFGGGEEAVEVDAGRDAHRLEEIHQVLGADVAGETAAVLHLRRMAADAAEGRVEVPHADRKSVV